VTVTCASGEGGTGFKSRVDQIFHPLPTTRHHCNRDVWALAQSRGDGHLLLVTPERVLSEYNEDFFLKKEPTNMDFIAGHEVKCKGRERERERELLTLHFCCLCTVIANS